MILPNTLWSVIRFRLYIAHFLFFNFYSFRIAASGLNFIARFAGKYPASTPTSTANAIDNSTSHHGIYEILLSVPVDNTPLLPTTTLMTADIAKLKIFPAMPPSSPMNAASNRNISRIFLRLHPSTFITPISFVRS